MTNPWPSGEGAPECSKRGCHLPANPHNPEGLCAVCEEDAIDRGRHQPQRTGYTPPLWLIGGNERRGWKRGKREE